MVKLRKSLLRRHVSADGGGILGGTFSVQLGFRGLVYREGDHSARVGVERLRGGWLIYLDTLKEWEPPFINERLMPEQILHIQQNIVKALDTMGIKYSPVGVPGWA